MDTLGESVRGRRPGMACAWRTHLAHSPDGRPSIAICQQYLLRLIRHDHRAHQGYARGVRDRTAGLPAVRAVQRGLAAPPHPRLVRAATAAIAIRSRQGPAPAGSASPGSPRPSSRATAAIGWPRRVRTPTACSGTSPSATPARRGSRSCPMRPSSSSSRPSCSPASPRA